MLTLTFLYYGTGLNLRPQYLTQGAHLFSLLSSENTPPPLPRVPVLSLLCHLRRVGLLVSFQYSGWHVLEERGVKKKKQSDATKKQSQKRSQTCFRKLPSQLLRLIRLVCGRGQRCICNPTGSTSKTSLEKNTEVPPRGAISCPGLPAEFSLVASL